MYRRKPFATRTLILMAIDAALAFSLGRFLDANGPPQFRFLIEVCAALLTVLTLSLLGGYLDVLRKGWSSHLYSLVIVSVVAALGCMLAEMSGVVTGEGTALWLPPTALFLGLLAVRFTLVHAHRLMLVPKRLWVIADSAVLATHLGRKASAPFYKVVHASGPPAERDLRRVLPVVDAILATSTLRLSVQPLCATYKKQLLLFPSPAEVLLHSAQAHPIHDGLILSMPTHEIRPLWDLGKRALDILGASLLLILFSPVMAALYFLIPRDSTGKALYRQPRRGVLGTSFDILKFRTMIDDAEGVTGPILARRHDHRITRLGKVLRATRLDELPQLINVLKGEMSLVGPRPERECFALLFDQQLPEYPLRTVVKPGLTGLAQVCGSYSTSVEDKLRLDLWYIANQSFWLDLNLLLQTGRVVLRREQAAGLEMLTPPENQPPKHVGLQFRKHFGRTNQFCRQGINAIHCDFFADTTGGEA